MFKAANSIRNIVNINRFYFSKDLFINGANPIRERVMSTPSWPVPYYQRVGKAYPIKCKPSPIQNSRNPTLDLPISLLLTSPGFMPRKSSMTAFKEGKL